MDAPSPLPQWRFDYPEQLPISARRAEIVELLRTHPVVILAGDTGSGKTTQLPKFCLEAGRGVRGRIACTQPRRVAATSVSRRVAEELGVTWGREVGCKVRFDDNTARETRVKFLTDGMLLAEAQGDPLLREYDTIIVDEAHERSLNIDFLLGLLRRLVEQRRDLQVVITSATIDTEAFSKAFGGAPIIEVSGRTFPVEVVYSPVDELLEESGEFTYIEAVAESVERILLESDTGDILVFLPTERDIRDASELLRGRGLGKVDVLPLFGRLSGSDQQRVFSPTSRRKIVVATNIAETSLTIPGIRFVVDTGEARLARFNPRTRTKRLPVEKISRSSADQRKGRCGRVMDGVCIRLYSEADYLDRPRFTQPEIQRCNLAEVILRMLQAGWGEIESFPFLDPPLPAAIRGGLQLLEELGAIDERRNLTALGREMARLPLDPTLARMVLQARREHALREVLVIAAGLSVPDPRERPLNEEAKADAAHRRFLNPDSDFLTLLGIWETFHEDFERLSHARLRRFCKEHYLSFTRMREWIELHEQIARTLEGLGGFNLEQSAPEAGDNPRRFGGSFYRSVHRSLIPGLLANAARHEEGPWYRVAGDRKAMLFPGSGLFRRPESGGRGPQSREKPAAGKEKFPEWLVAAEVMETSRLYARTVARIDPQWLLELGASVIKISHSEPFFVEEGSRVVVKETARLHGLELRTRAVDFGRIDPVAAQEIFIREALVEGRITSPLPFLEHNRRIRDKVELMRTKLPGVALQDVDEAVYRFYRAALPPVSSVHDLNRVWKERVGREPEFLRLTEVALLGDLPTAVETAQFPDSLPLENSALPIEYAYKPGDEKDGVTLKVPVQRARLLDEGMLDWLVPAFLAEKIEHLIRALPKQHRVRLQPVAETSRRLASDLRPVPGGLAAALANHLETRFGIRLNEEERAALVLPQHLRTRVEVVDAQGRTIAAARALSEVQGGLANHERELARRPDAEIAAAWRAAATRLERVSHPGQGWIFGDLQECVEVTESAGVAVRAWLGLRRESVGVALRLFRSPQEAAAGLEDALEHLLADALRSELAYAEDDLRQINKLKLALVGFAPYDKVREQALICLRRHLCRRPVSPLTAERFSAVATAAKAEARGIAYKLVDRLQAVLEARTAAMGVKRPYREQAADIERLCPADLLGTTPFVQLQHVPRYLKAVVLRAEAAQMNPPADEERARQVRKAQEALAAWLKARGSSPETRKVAEDYRWMLEEFRVSLFAQKLGTAVPISLVRLERRLAEAAVGTG